MKIININSKICLNKSQEIFVEEVLRAGSYSLDMFRDMRTIDYLIDSIPLFLMDMQTFDEELKKSEIYLNEWDREYPATELLGFYRRENRTFFNNTPMIAICLERIKYITSSKDEFLFLTILTIIHEFAHAQMDIREENKDYPIRDEFFTYMEESFANAITLKTIKNYSRGKHMMCKCKFIADDKLFDFAENFVKRQPPEYAFGYDIFEARLERMAIRWKISKEALFQAEKLKKEYLDYIKQNYNKIDKSKLEEILDKLFDRKRLRK